MMSFPNRSNVDISIGNAIRPALVSKFPLNQRFDPVHLWIRRRGMSIAFLLGMEMVWMLQVSLDAGCILVST